MICRLVCVDQNEPSAWLQNLNIRENVEKRVDVFMRDKRPDGPHPP